MKNTQLIRKIQLLRTDEYSNFLKWLKSPWCNSNKRLVLLFQLLRKFAPEFSSPHLNKTFLFNKLFPNKDFNDRWMRNLMSELSKQVDRFLCFQRLDQKDELQFDLLKQEYLEREQDQQFNFWAEKSIALITNKDILDYMDFLNLGLLYEGLYFQPNPKFRRQLDRDVLKKAEENIDTFYAITKLRLLSEFAERRKILKVNEALDQKEKWLSVFKNLKGQPGINLYFNRLAKSDDASPQKLKELYKTYQKNFNFLALREQKQFLYYLLNDAARLISGGYPKGNELMFNLYKFGLKHNLLFHKNQITSFTFNNIVTIGNVLLQTSFTQQFIQNHYLKLPNDIQEDGKIWATGHSLYYKKQWDKARQLLIAHKFKKSLFNIQSRMLLLQIYFDLFQTEQIKLITLSAYFEATKKFFIRKSYFKETVIKSYLNFIKHTHALAKIYDKKKLANRPFEVLSKKVNTEKHLHGRKWLTNKITEIKKQQGGKK